MKVLGTQSCPTLCSPMDHSPPGSSVHEIFQARLLEQVASSSSRGSSQPRDGPHISVSPALGGGFFITSATWEYVLLFPSICQWTWFWASSRNWWWTGNPGMLQSMGLQGAGHNWATELNWLNIEERVQKIKVGHIRKYLLYKIRKPWYIHKS